MMEKMSLILLNNAFRDVVLVIVLLFVSALLGTVLCFFIMFLINYKYAALAVGRFLLISKIYILLWNTSCQLGQGQKLYFTWAKWNANKKNPLFSFIYIRFGSCEVRRLTRALLYRTRQWGWLVVMLDFRRSLLSGLPSPRILGEERGLISRTAAGNRA